MLKQIPSDEASSSREEPALGFGEKGAASGLRRPRRELSGVPAPGVPDGGGGGGGCGGGVLPIVEHRLLGFPLLRHGREKNDGMMVVAVGLVDYSAMIGGKAAEATIYLAY